MRSDETLLTGDIAAKVTAAAKAKEPSATIERVETDSDGIYEAHMVRTDGTHVTVKVDASFAVTAVQEGGAGWAGAAVGVTTTATTPRARYQGQPGEAPASPDGTATTARPAHLTRPAEEPDGRPFRGRSSLSSAGVSPLSSDPRLRGCRTPRASPTSGSS